MARVGWSGRGTEKRKDVRDSHRWDPQLTDHLANVEAKKTREGRLDCLLAGSGETSRHSWRITPRKSGSSATPG